MKLKNSTVLETVFGLQGNFAQGGLPPTKKFAYGIEVAPFKDNAAAACCISADFEMGWGWRSLGLEGAALMGERERLHVPLILGLLEEYSIPITWATVGHLFLESCACSTDGRAHPNMPRPLTDGTWSGDWYWPDPCSNVRRAPAWYGPDLIQQIVDSRVHHEIGTHSFSHINFQARYSSPDVVRCELEACIDAMRPFAARPRTLIFPRHQAEPSYLPLLASAGVVVVRHRDGEHGIRLSYPERTSAGVYRIFESMNLRIAKRYEYLDKVKIFIRKAMTRHAVYSLWFHPSDPTEWFEPQLREILDYIDSQRESGRLWVATMKELAGYCEAREQLRITADRTADNLTLSVRSSLDVANFGAAEVSLIIPVFQRPNSAWLELHDGASRPAQFRIENQTPAQVIVTIPVNTRTLQLTF